MALICPVCRTGYAEGYEGRRDGSMCGDWSQGQKLLCVGRLMPVNEFQAAEWTWDPHEVSSGDHGHLDADFDALKLLDKQACGQLPSCTWQAVPPDGTRAPGWLILSGNLPVAVVFSGPSAEADAKLIAASRNTVRKLFALAEDTPGKNDFPRNNVFPIRT